MGFARDPGDEAAAPDVAAAAAVAPGKRARSEAPVQRRVGPVGAGPPPATPTLLPSPPAARGDDPFGLHLLEASVVQRRADGHGPDEATVHAAAARGLEGAASTLPHAEAIQRSFGRHDVSGVQAHVGEAATQAAGAMGAEAYATGNHVAFAGAPSLHTAAHEAAHVVQQRAGVHLKGGVGEVGDAHEQHADQVADAVVSGRSAEALLDRYGGAEGGGSSTGVQMYISIGLAKPRYVKTAEEAWDGIVEAAKAGDPSNIAGQLAAREEAVKATLREWIASSGELGTNAREYGKAVLGMEMSEQPAQWRKYRDFYELGVAVVHETHPQTVANKAYEGDLAAHVCADGWVNGQLNVVKALILQRLFETVEDKMKAFESEVDGGAFFSMGKVRGSYRQIGSYKQGGMKLSVVGFLKQISDCFQTNIAVIHDMMEHLSGPGGGAKFPTSLAGTVPEPRDEAYETTLLENPPEQMDFEGEVDPSVGRRTRTRPKKAMGEEDPGVEIDKKGMKGRTNVGTRDVKDIDTITGMVMNAPMLAGKSMTTARMLELVEWAGGGADEKIAVAWAIFAYWKHLYPASTVPFHTFHEVMDIARNYGVPYRPFHYPDLALGGIDYDAVGTKKFNDKVPD